MLAGITEADEHWPERIEQALTFRTEAIFTSRFTAAGDIERVTRNMHAQADMPRFFVFFHQAIVGMTELSGELFIMLRTEPGRVFTFGFCGVFTALTAGPLFDRLSKKIILCAGIDVLPETD